MISSRISRSFNRILSSPLSSALASPLSQRKHSIGAMSTAAAATSAPAASGLPTFATLQLTVPADSVIDVRLNRPDKANAMDRAMWKDIRDAFTFLSSPDAPCRAVILSGAGNYYTSGLDIMDHVELFTGSHELDVSRKAMRLREMIRAYQDSLSSIEKCPKPVIAAIHGACIGGGVDMICAADIRFASADAWFCVKEAEIGLAADVGTLQRFPKIIGNDSLVRELAYTARRMPAEEALKHGLLSHVAVDKDSLYGHALATAKRIASLSPIAVQGTKINLNFSRGRSVSDGLEYNAVWNMGMLQSSDLPAAATAAMSKKPAEFAKL